jgi:hypothetical protein
LAVKNCFENNKERLFNNPLGLTKSLATNAREVIRRSSVLQISPKSEKP